MKRRAVIIFLSFMLSACPAAAQEIESSIASIIGASSIEDVGQDVLERFAALYEHPVDINICSKARLLASGLFSSYQAASLKAYINENGEILSIAELGLVDGFSPDFAKSVEPFVTLRSYSEPGSAGKRHSADNSLLLKTGIRNTGTAGYGAKYRLEAEDIMEMGAVVKGDFGNKRMMPSVYGGHITYLSRKNEGRLLIGNFNAHFGQGLCLWSGFSLSGLYGLRSMIRSPNGVLPSLSFTNTDLIGAAADINFRRFAFSALTAFDFPGIMPAARITHNGRKGQISANAMCRVTGNRIVSAKTSLDMRACVRGTDIFTEAAFDIVNSNFAAIAGAIVPLGDYFSIAASARYYPINFESNMTGAARSFTKVKDEAAMTFGLRFKNIEFNSELSRHISDDRKQMKIFFSDLLNINDRFSVVSRLAWRVRDFDVRSRLAARSDLKWAASGLLLNFRIETVVSRRVGFLNYLEGGYKKDGKAIYARATLFAADNWDDRIYSYERDAPGSFSVPAYYGRGYSLSAYASTRIDIGRTVLKIYLRGAVTEYPWTKDKKKPGRAELKFQLLYTW